MIDSRQNVDVLIQTACGVKVPGAVVTITRLGDVALLERRNYPKLQPLSAGR